MNTVPNILEVGRIRLGRLCRIYWPWVIAIALLLCALAESLGSFWLDDQSQQLDQQTLQLSRQYQSDTKMRTAAQWQLQTGVETIGSSEQHYLQDLNHFFQIAKDAGITIGMVDYQVQANDKVPLTVRIVEMRLTEDYPKVKGFISAVLQQLPNASLQEISVDRKDALTAQASTALKFSFVYASAPDGHQGVAR